MKYHRGLLRWGCWRILTKQFYLLHLLILHAINPVEPLGMFSYHLAIQTYVYVWMFHLGNFFPFTLNKIHIIWVIMLYCSSSNIIIFCRLLLWYIDPLVLKHDLSEILRETIERPFLCLDQEFHERTEWRMIVMCLMFCPFMFIETRALLHKWFLET